MDSAVVAGYEALGITIAVAIISTVVFLGAIEQTRLRKLACICTHPIRRHMFRAGQCFDCQCQTYIDEPGPKYVE